MMFATLDDLAGSVEMLVFGKALGEYEPLLLADEIVLVKGRVDHKEAGSTCLIVQSVEPYNPDRQELERAQAKARATAAADAAGAKPLHLSVSADNLSAETLAELRQAIEESPGQAEVLLDIHTTSGTRRVRLGSAFRVRHTLALRADLETALGGIPAAVSA